jgi:mannose-6-phosphate isomerase-like protein (cupin superfamily)
MGTGKWAHFSPRTKNGSFQPICYTNAYSPSPQRLKCASAVLAKPELPFPRCLSRSPAILTPKLKDTPANGQLALPLPRKYNDGVTKLHKISVSEIAAKLEQPFSMMDVTLVGDILVSVYICQGTLDWHRHLDIDELFWVHEGTILVESEWGEKQLRPGELAIVPKGVGHRSGSEERASVLLMRCGVAPDRKNGRRRLYAIFGEGSLKRVSLLDAVRSAPLPFQFKTATRFEDTVLQVAWGEGTWPVDIPSVADHFLLVLNGTATIRTSESMLHLHPGDFTVVPEGTVYQLSTTRDTALVQMTGYRE